MEVVKNCTSTSDVECRCREGYVCSHPHIHLCDSCIPVSTTIPSSTSADVPTSPTSTATSTEIVKIKLGKHCCFFYMMCAHLHYKVSVLKARLDYGLDQYFDTGFQSMARAGFMHRHSRHVPMLTYPRGPNYNKEKYLLRYLFYGVPTTAKEPKSQNKCTNQINITHNRIKTTTISMFS